MRKQSSSPIYRYFILHLSPFHHFTNKIFQVMEFLKSRFLFVSHNTNTILKTTTTCRRHVSPFRHAISPISFVSSPVKEKFEMGKNFDIRLEEETFFFHFNYDDINLFRLLTTSEAFKISYLSVGTLSFLIKNSTAASEETQHECGVRILISCRHVVLSFHSILSNKSRLGSES